MQLLLDRGVVLRWAVAEENEALVRLLLDRGADVNAKDNDGWTLLRWAAVEENEALVRLLLDRGADVNAKDKYGWTVLRWAAAEENEALVRLLLNRGADVNAKDNDGRTALRRAVDEGHEAMVRLLLDRGADVDAKDNDGETVLRRAAVRGHEAVMQLLLDRGADVNAKNNDGETTLQEAAGEGQDDDDNKAGGDEGQDGDDNEAGGDEGQDGDDNEAGGDEGQDGDDNEAGGDEDAEISMQLDQVFSLFRFVDGRAAFEALYRNDLPRRLRMARSASADAESGMLTMLDAEYGPNFTHNLEPMFKDMKLARDEMVSYRSRLAEQGITPEIDLSVNVFSSGAWRTYPDVNVTVPDSIKKAIENFDKHYKTKHNDRKLTWKHNLAHCLLKAFFPRGDKEIIVGAFQAIVLLLFNDVPKNQPLSYTDIQVATSLSKTVSPLDSPTSTLHSSSPSPLNSPSLSTSHSPNSSLNALGDEELKRTLYSLACAKHRVLTKTPKGRDVSNTDTFAFNSGFYDPKYHIKINQIQTYERVAADRRYQT
jgi:hypothetical protein